jgi:hypothetical protein
MPYGQPEQPQAGPIGPTGPTSPPTVGGLLGSGAGSSTPPSPAPSPEDHVEALLAQFRDLTMQVQALARQYPAAQQDLAIANDSLINAMTKVVASMSAESSSAPPVLA